MHKSAQKLMLKVCKNAKNVFHTFFCVMHVVNACQKLPKAYRMLKHTKMVTQGKNHAKTCNRCMPKMQNTHWMLKHANVRHRGKNVGKYALDACPTPLKLLKMLHTKKPAKISTRCMPKHTKHWLDAKTCTTHGRNMHDKHGKQVQCMENVQIHTEACTTCMPKKAKHAER